MGTGLNRVRNRVGYNNIETYKQFLDSKLYTDYLTKYNKEISITDYKKIISETASTIRDEVINNAIGFKLPNALGYLCVIKFEQKDSYRVIDWGKTHTTGKTIHNMNLHSFGNMFKIKLFKNSYYHQFKNYAFVAHRIFKRQLAKQIKSGKQNYLPLDYSYFGKSFKINNILKNI